MAQHFAVVDVGSNAMRCQVAVVDKPKHYRVIEQDRQPVRLGHDVFRTGKLNPETVDAALNVLGDFKKLADRFHVKVIRAVGTEDGRGYMNQALDFVSVTAIKWGETPSASDAFIDPRPIFPPFSISNRQVDVQRTPVQPAHPYALVALVERNAIEKRDFARFGNVHLEQSIAHQIQRHVVRNAKVELWPLHRRFQLRRDDNAEQLRC